MLSSIIFEQKNEQINTNLTICHHFANNFIVFCPEKRQSSSFDPSEENRDNDGDAVACQLSHFFPQLLQ